MSKPMSAANRSRLRKKIKYYSFCNQWGGYLTPIEILWVVENLKIENWLYPHALRNVKQGIMSATWFYFSCKEDPLTII